MKTFTGRLSILVALILCVTIGGVYATWSYASTANVTESVQKGVSLTPAELEGTLGIYEILVQDFSIVIDQTAPGDYTPELELFSSTGTSGDLRLTFTPRAVASDDVKQNGLLSTVSFSSALMHEGQDIFSFPKTLTIGAVGSGETYEWVNNGDGTFSATIPNAELYECIQLAYTNKLDTYTKYQAFDKSLETGNIVISITHDEVVAGA